MNAVPRGPAQAVPHRRGMIVSRSMDDVRPAPSQRWIDPDDGVGMREARASDGPVVAVDHPSVHRDERVVLAYPLVVRRDRTVAPIEIIEHQERQAGSLAERASERRLA